MSSESEATTYLDHERLLNQMETKEEEKGNLIQSESPKKLSNRSLLLYSSFGEDEISKKIRNTLGEGTLHHYAKANYSQEISQLSSSCPPEDRTYFIEALLEGNRQGNTPAMVAAKYNNKEALLALLTPILSVDISAQKRFLHLKNNDGHNILFLVSHHPGSLFVSWSILMELEKRVHEGNSRNIKLCLKEHLGSTSSAQTSIQLLHTLQAEDKLRPKTNFLHSLGSIFILKMLFYFLDVATDVLLVAEYFQGWTKDMERRSAVLFPGQDHCKDHLFTSSIANDTKLECYASKLSQESMFWMTLSIVLLPPLFFIFEQLHFGLCSKVAPRILGLLLNVFLWMAWPVVVFFRHFWFLYKYSTNTGEGRVSTYGPALKEARTMGSRTHLIEVCSEASLQPLLQVYLIFVTIVKWGSSLTEELHHNTSPSSFVQSVLLLTPKQVICVFVSILTLSLSFTARYRNKKDNVVGILPSLIYFLSTLCFVLARILSFQMFAYSLGPGNFAFAFIGVLVHVLLFSFLHFIFSDSLTHVRSHSILHKSAILLYDCIFNGLANIYVHNHIEVFYKNTEIKESTSSTTLLRQSLFDAIFFLENLAMILSSRHTLKMSFEGAFDHMALVIGGLYATGILLKIAFYSCCHIWSELLVRRKNTRTLTLGRNMKILFFNDDS